MTIIEIKKEIEKNVKLHHYKAIKINEMSLTVDYKNVLIGYGDYFVKESVENICSADEEMTEEEAIALNVNFLLDILDDKVFIGQPVIPIKELRSQTGLSQSAFAKKFHLNKGTLANWEQGFRKPPEYILFMIRTIIDQEDTLNTIETRIKAEKFKDHSNMYSEEVCIARRNAFSMALDIVEQERTKLRL